MLCFSLKRPEKVREKHGTLIIFVNYKLFAAFLDLCQPSLQQQTRPSASRAKLQPPEQEKSFLPLEKSLWPWGLNKPWNNKITEWKPIDSGRILWDQILLLILRLPVKQDSSVQLVGLELCSAAKHAGIKPLAACKRSQSSGCASLRKSSSCHHCTWTEKFRKAQSTKSLIINFIHPSAPEISGYFSLPGYTHLGVFV